MLLKNNTIFRLITELNPQHSWGFSSVIKRLDILQKLKDLKKSTLLRLILLNIDRPIVGSSLLRIYQACCGKKSQNMANPFSKKLMRQGCLLLCPVDHSCSPCIKSSTTVYVVQAAKATPK